MKVKYAERTSRLLLIPVFLGLLVLLAALPTDPAQALQTIYVTTAEDELNLDNDCSLREAIQAANSNSVIGGCPKGGIGGVDTIIVPDDLGIYYLTKFGTNEDFNTEGDLDVAADGMLNPSSVEIIGDGAATTIIDAGNLGDRVLHVLPGNTAKISGLTMQHGGGGGIRNEGTLTVDGSTIRVNFGGLGGGGIYNSGTLTVNTSTIDYNTAVSYGGGIYNRGTLMLNSSNVSHNSSSFGSGIFNDTGGATAIVTNSTLHGNLITSTDAGQVHNYLGTITLNSTTVGGDLSGARGLYNEENSTATIKNTILAGILDPGQRGDCAGDIISAGYNLIESTADCNITGDTGSNITGTAPRLAPMANYGGPTETHALCTGLSQPHQACTGRSPAIDAVPYANCETTLGVTVTEDQRGVSRPQPPGGACDIGAYEVCPCVIPPPDMVAWWPLDETAGTSFQDIIGGNDATPFASPIGSPHSPQPVSGAVNGAIHFPKFGDGLSGARVSPGGDLAAIGSADFTIDAWVKFGVQAPANIPHYIVNKFDSVSNTGYALYVISPGIPNNERLEFKWGDGINVGTVATIPPAVAANQWHHVAVAFARNVGSYALDIRLYVDGVQQGIMVGNPPGLGSLVNNLVLEIGWEPSTTDEAITLDELEIFERALRQSEIQSIFDAHDGGKCTGCSDQELLAGDIDFFSGPGPSSPSQALKDKIGDPLNAGFDNLGPDEQFGHTFILPQGRCIKAAELELRVKPVSGSSGSEDDAIHLGAGDTATTFSQWSSSFGLPGLLPVAWNSTNFPNGTTLTLDLSNLPGTGFNLIPDLDVNRILDIFILDDTGVDYLKLTVTFCDCSHLRLMAVGGTVELLAGGSGSSVPWGPLAAVAASVMAGLAVGGWYMRRRWLR